MPAALRTARPTWSDFMEEFRETHARSLIEPIVAGCAVIAYADGWLSPEEEKRVASLIADFRPIEVFGVQDVLSAFADVSRRFEEDHDRAEQEALDLVGELRARPRHARLLLETCCAIATADGALDREERQASLRLCSALGLDPADFDLREAR
jgi:tellurite resistance protein TerB